MIKAIDTSQPNAEVSRPTETPLDAGWHWLNRSRVLVAAAITLAVAGCSGPVGGGASATNEANPPQNQTATASAGANPTQNQTAAQQGSGQGMMGNGQMMGPGGKGGTGGMMGNRSAQQPAKDRGIIGISPILRVDAVGAPGRLMVRRVVPYSPAYNAGIEDGDQIVAVDGKAVKGKSLDEVAKAIRGAVGGRVRLTLVRKGQSREVSLMRVAQASEHAGNNMSGGGGMGNAGMMNMMSH